MGNLQSKICPCCSEKKGNDLNQNKIIPKDNNNKGKEANMKFEISQINKNQDNHDQEELPAPSIVRFT